LLSISRAGTRRNARLAAIAAAALTATLGFAESAAAKPTAYKGTISGGYEISFKRSGGAIKRLTALIPTTCVPTLAGVTPQAGGEIYEPPGRLPLGRQVTRSALQDPAMHYSDVTKNYRFDARIRRNGTITGRLHLNFSYESLIYGSSLQLVGWVCQGDATFKARPAGR
jgi:hypothetical protein